MRVASRHDDNGSIAMAVIVVMITTGLVLAMVLMVDQGMRASRRSGDSANALQVADAGVNAAVQFIPTVPASFAPGASLPEQTGTVGGGKYTYTATKVTNQVWNVNAIGEDAAGLRRRVVAQAVAEPLFRRPLYVRASSEFKSGMTLDSYSGPENAQTRCTKKGILTINQPETMAFGGNAGPNCQAAAYANDWKASIDGCELPGDESSLLKPLPKQEDSALKPPEAIIGKSKCPDPPDTRRVAPRLFPPSVGKPAAPYVGDGTGSRTCDALSPLIWGTTYYDGSVTLLDGCWIKGIPADKDLAMSKPVRVFAKDIYLGTDSGGASNQVINAPQAVFCGTAYSNTSPPVPYPVSGYCSKWVSLLRLNIIGEGTLTMRNKLRFFWGLINAPDGQVRITSEALEVWGASIGSTMGTGSQFIWHYDDSLGEEIGSGRFLVANWREEGTSAP